MRSLIAIFLLLNYLLVVGAGMRVGRPEPAFSAAHPYVHSEACQQHNYLRLDCFEHCNGERYGLQQKLPGDSALHFLTQLQGLDVHDCAPTLPAVPARPRAWGSASTQHPLLSRAGLPPGFGGFDYPPPRRA